MNWIKKLFNKCEHEYKFVRNIYGDQINQHNGMRSIWKCSKCGHIQYREYLHKTGTLCEELDKLSNDFYKDKYKNWCISHSEILNKMTKEMRERAFNGFINYDIVLVCNEKYDDKYYYEKWFDENGLQHEKKSLDNEDYEINRYEFHIRWSYK